MKRVVILGGSGFIGSHLLSQLKKNNIPCLGISSAQIDLSASDAVGKLMETVTPEDSLVFASCITRDKGKDDLPTLMKNLRMAEAVGQLLEKQGSAQLIYFSSDAVYKDGISLVREDSEKDPNGLYGITHVVREKMLESSSHKKGVPLTIVRPCAVYGHGDTHNGYGPNRFLRTALSDGKITLFGEGEEKRDHIFVEDVCRLIELCLMHKTTGTLNLATGHSFSFAEAAQTVIKILGKPVALDCRPRQSLITHRTFDNTALVKAFPSFQFVSFEEGIRQSA